MKFSRWLFRIAGIYGLIVLVPQYFLESKIGEQTPPAITHPEYFYGFVGVGIAWQIAFLIIAQIRPVSADDYSGVVKSFARRGLNPLMILSYWLLAAS